MREKINKTEVGGGGQDGRESGECGVKVVLCGGAAGGGGRGAVTC